jgi:hypothetical protein
MAKQGKTIDEIEVALPDAPAPSCSGSRHRSGPTRWWWFNRCTQIGEDAFSSLETRRFVEAILCRIVQIGVADVAPNVEVDGDVTEHLTVQRIGASAFSDAL